MENMIGKKVKIVSNFGGNRFEYGEIVEIIEPHDLDESIFLAKNEAGKSWYISHKDYVHIHEEKQSQISRRDYFAAAALQGLMSNTEESNASSKTVLYVLGLSSDTGYDFLEHHPMYIAKLSVMYADELIKQLDKE